MRASGRGAYISVSQRRRVGMRFSLLFALEIRAGFYYTGLIK